MCVSATAALVQGRFKAAKTSTSGATYYEDKSFIFTYLSSKNLLSTGVDFKRGYAKNWDSKVKEIL